MDFSQSKSLQELENERTSLLEDISKREKEYIQFLKEKLRALRNRLERLRVHEINLQIQSRSRWHRWILGSPIESVRREIAELRPKIAETEAQIANYPVDIKRILSSEYERLQYLTDEIEKRKSEQDPANRITSTTILYDEVSNLYVRITSIEGPIRTELPDGNIRHTLIVNFDRGPNSITILTDDTVKCYISVINSISCEYGINLVYSKVSFEGNNKHFSTPYTNNINRTIQDATNKLIDLIRYYDNDVSIEKITFDFIEMKVHGGK